MTQFLHPFSSKPWLLIGKISLPANSEIFNAWLPCPKDVFPISSVASFMPMLICKSEYQAKACLICLRKLLPMSVHTPERWQDAHTMTSSGSHQRERSFFPCSRHCTSDRETLQEAGDVAPATAQLGKSHHHRWKECILMKLEDAAMVDS